MNSESAPPRWPLWLKTIAAVLAMEVLGSLGALVTVQQIDRWYASLTAPPGTPPNALFGPVWTLLYALMGVALARIWHHRLPGQSSALHWFGVQFLLNLLWTPLFFGWHQILAALILIVGLLATIVMTIRSFASVDRLAAFLLIPYALWVGYATYLNAGFLVLNR